MVNIPTRMRRLNTKLLSIRLGPGAAILPKNVTAIHMEMGKSVSGGHRAGRKFWRNMLPRLQYHNPTVPMTVKRIEDQDCPSILSIHFASPISSTTDATATSSTGSDTSTNVIKIDMKMKESSDVLAQLMEATGATQVEPTPDEVELMRDLEEQAAKSKEDSIRSLAARAQWKKEKDMLRAAREGNL